MKFDNIVAYFLLALCFFVLFEANMVFISAETILKALR